MYEREDAPMVQSVTGLDLDAIELRIIAMMEQQRDMFEAAFAADNEETPESLHKFRDGEGYNCRHYFLNGAWHGWKLHARKTGNDPFLGFMLEAANAGEVAAYDYGCLSCEDAVRRVIEGDDNGVGATNEPWNSLRNQLLRLKADAERWRKLRRLSYSMPAGDHVVTSPPAATREIHDTALDMWADGLSDKR